MSIQEKRRHGRIHFKRQVEIDFFTEVYRQCQVTNISMSGMYVTGTFAQDVEDQCYVTLVQQGGNVYLKLEALAKIIRQEDEGIALQFTSMSYESLLSLEIILLYQTREKSTDTEVVLPKDLPFEINEETSGFPDKYKVFLDRTE